jgi:flagellar assembly protein FliH
MEKEEPGKVGIKAILKGSSAGMVKPAAMSGFRVADFQANPRAKESSEDVLKKEISNLQSKIAVLNSEIADSHKKSEAESKAAHEKGVKEGKALGETEGEKKALEKWKGLLKTLQDETAKSLEKLTAQQKENFAKIESFCADIAISVAKRVFCEEAAQNPNIVSYVIKEAFTFLGQEEKIKIRLNPQNISYAEENESFWKPVLTQLKNIEFVFDEKIEKGGCVLEAENGSSVDMRVETIFRHIEEVVRQIYSSQAPAQSE